METSQEPRQAIQEADPLAEIGWRVCQDIGGWSQIHEPGVDLLIWERSCPELSDVEEQTQWETLPGERFVTRPSEAPESLAERMNIPALSTPIRDLWLADLTHLVEQFAEVTKAPNIRVRMDKITSDGCRRFHIDNITIRLICTYIGPSTEWLSNQSIRRHEGQDSYDHKAINQLPHLSVALLKGRKHPNHEGRIFHRSPQIARAGLRRFVFCLDDSDIC